MTTRQSLWGLIAISALLRAALAASVGPSNDESYYSLYAAHRDWSYFDHPPMVAVVANAGLVLSESRTSAFFLRLGSIVLFAGSTLVMERLTTRIYGPGAGVFAAYALNVSGYFSVVVGTCALPDGPLVFFWLLTLERFVVALRSSGRLLLWAEVGLAWGGAMLSKYQAVFLPAGALLFLVLEPSARTWLSRLGPYFAIGIGLLCFSPVLWWNATHHWVSFAFQGGRAFGEVVFRPASLVTAIGGQAVYLFPWVWLSTLAVVIHRVLHLRSRGITLERLLLCFALWPLLLFTAVACLRPVLPHWSLVGFLSLLPMLGHNWSGRLVANPVRLQRRLILVGALPVVLSVLVAEQARTGFLHGGRQGSRGLILGCADPTLDLFGWDQVARELENRGLIGLPDTFLFTSNWYYSGQLAFATGSAMPVLCYHAHDARGFAFWSRPGHWVGKSGILVAVGDRSIEPACFDRWFSRIEAIGEFSVTRAGVPVHKVRLFHCVCQLRAFPFDDRDAILPRAQVATESSLGKENRR
jgi:4-amino-4-deoxy-L-arabinose transferase-like glycosyltransferase